MTVKNIRDKIFAQVTETIAAIFGCRGKSGLHRAACRVTPGESNLEDSVTEKQTAILGVRD